MCIEVSAWCRNRGTPREVEEQGEGGAGGRVCIGGRERDKRRVGVIDTSCLRCRISASFQGAITLRAHMEMDTVCKSCTHVWQNSRNASVHFGTAHCLQPQSDCICSFVVTNTRECTVAGIISLQVRTD